MPAFRQPTSREHRREWWRRQLARQKSANLSVTEFCRQLGVSVTTFYYWKKRVHEAPPILSGQVPVENLLASSDYHRRGCPLEFRAGVDPRAQRGHSTGAEGHATQAAPIPAPCLVLGVRCMDGV